MPPKPKMRWILLLLWWIVPPAYGLSPLLLDDNNEQELIFPAIELFEDPSSTLTIQDILLPEYQKKFKPSPDRNHVLGYTRSAWWVRFNVTRTGESRWLLAPEANSEQTHLIYSIPQPFLDGYFIPSSIPRIDGSPMPLHLLNLKANQPYTLYIKISNLKSKMAFTITLSRENDLSSWLQARFILFGIAIGGIFSLVIYNIFLFFTFYERSYLSLALLMTCFGIDWGHAVFPLILEHPLYPALRYLPLTLALSAITSLSRNIIQPKKYSKQLDNVFIFFTYLPLGACFVLPFLDFSAKFFFSTIVIIAPLVFLSSCWAAYQGDKLSKKFLLSISAFILLSMPMLLHMFEIVSLKPQITISFLGIGFLSFMLLLSLIQMERTRELRIQTKLAQVANEEKTTFLTTMSHELRTPMHAVMGLSSLMQSTPMNNEQQDYMNKLATASRHMLRLIDDVLDLSKIEQSGVELNHSPFNLTNLLNDTQNLLREQAKRKQLQLTFHHRFSDPGEILGDSTRLAQIILNLVGNAIKFTEHGKVDFAIVTVDHGTENTLTLHFEVSDTGIGISPEQLQKLFKPFSQANNCTSKRYGGTGLGLVISQRLVRVMGGELYVISKENEGSRFFFTLKFPYNMPIANTKPTTSKQPLHAVIPAPTHKHILLVDDDEINRFVARRFLESRQIRVTLAADGREAVAAITHSPAPPIDMIFMDVGMPDIDGYETTRQIRRMGYHLPIIALTAHAIEGERERCTAAGMDDFFTKPFELEDLEQMIRKWA